MRPEGGWKRSQGAKFKNDVVKGLNLLLCFTLLLWLPSLMFGVRIMLQSRSFFSSIYLLLEDHSKT